jgi:hypothetical protein
VSPDPFGVLGLPASASLEEVRAARRRLAKALHPDRGGDERRMQEVNAAFDLAVRSILRPTLPPRGDPGPDEASPVTARRTGRPAPRTYGRVQRDDAAFVVHAPLDVAFEALVGAAGRIGSLGALDHGELIEFRLGPPRAAVRLTLLPEGLGTMVSILTVGARSVEEVRDVLIAALQGVEPAGGSDPGAQ